jgi:hypothetical protein
MVSLRPYGFGGCCLRFNDLPATLWPKHHRQETSRRLLHFEARDLNEATAESFPGLSLF